MFIFFLKKSSLNHRWLFTNWKWASICWTRSCWFGLSNFAGGRNPILHRVHIRKLAWHGSCNVCLRFRNPYWHLYWAWFLWTIFWWKSGNFWKIAGLRPFIIGKNRWFLSIYNRPVNMHPDKAKLLLLKLIHLFAREVLLVKKLEIEETKTT